MLINVAVRSNTRADDNELCNLESWSSDEDYAQDGTSLFKKTTTPSTCRLLKWEAKTRHGVSFVPALPKTLEGDLKQQPVCQDSPKDSL
ncbi:hypothetical protein TNCV_2551041 [Trichonephila clavipes]|nr:hypothetical protein TNCV_2551041 [Trichonephila clavipes]